MSGVSRAACYGLRRCSVFVHLVGTPMAERATTASIAASVAAHLAAFVAMGFVDPVVKLDAIEVMYMPGAVEPMRVQAEPNPKPSRSDVPSSAGSRPAPRGTRPARHVEEAESKPLEEDATPDAAAVPLTDFREGSRAVKPAGPIDPRLLLGGRDVMPEIDKAKPEGPARPKDPLGSHGFAPNGDGTFSYVDPQRRCGGRPCFRATLRRDGRVDFKGTIQPMGSPAMKSLLNRQKAELLKATYEIRLAMAARFAREQLDRRVNT